MQSLWMILASFGFALMGVCVKLASEIFVAPEIVFYRGILSVIFVFLVARYQGTSLRTVHWRFQIWRSASGFVSLLLYFYAVTMLPLATAVTLSYTAPLFLAIYLSWFSNVRIGYKGFAVLGLGFVGVLLLLRPAFHSDQILGEIIGLGSGMIGGLAYFNVKELGKRGETEERTVFYFFSFSTVASGIWMFFSDFHPIDWYGGFLLFAVAALGTIAQLAMTRAYKRGNTYISASLAYSTVIFASFFGMLIWHESLSLEACFSIAIIIASGLASSWVFRTRAAQE